MPDKNILRWYASSRVSKLTVSGESQNTPAPDAVPQVASKKRRKPDTSARVAQEIKKAIADFRRLDYEKPGWRR